MCACNSESAPDCFKTTGTIVTKEFSVANFSSIVVFDGVALTIKQDTVQRVVVKAGKNLIPEVKVSVKNNRLELATSNNCNWFRSYNPIQVFVYSPNLTEIRSSTQFDVKSEGILQFDSFRIVSEDYLNPDYQNTGNFYLNIDSNNFSLVFNNLSNCFITGNTKNASITFASGNGRFEGPNFKIDNLTFYHRGSNDMIVHPIKKVTGNIYSTGNVILKNIPDSIDVTEHYKGKLIYNN